MDGAVAAGPPAATAPAAMRALFPAGLACLVEAVELAEARARAAAKPVPVPAPAARAPARTFVCPEPACRRVFSKRWNLQTHSRIHDGTRPFECALCAKSFMWKSSLKSHARMHAKLAANGPIAPLVKRNGKRARPTRARAAAKARVVRPATSVVPAAAEDGGQS